MAGDRELEYFSIICFLHIFDFPWRCGIVSNSRLLRELKIFEGPFGCDIGDVGNIDMDGPDLFKIDFAEVKFIKCIVIFGLEIVSKSVSTLIIGLINTPSRNSFCWSPFAK